MGLWLVLEENRLAVEGLDPPTSSASDGETTHSSCSGPNSVGEASGVCRMAGFVGRLDPVHPFLDEVEVVSESYFSEGGSAAVKGKAILPPRVERRTLLHHLEDLASMPPCHSLDHRDLSSSVPGSEARDSDREYVIESESAKAACNAEAYQCCRALADERLSQFEVDTGFMRPAKRELVARIARADRVRKRQRCT